MPGPHPVPPIPPGKPRRPALYIHRLDTLRGCRMELARLYAAARRSEIGTADASRLANILAIIARVLEGAELEARVALLETGEGEALATTEPPEP